MSTTKRRTRLPSISISTGSRPSSRIPFPSEKTASPNSTRQTNGLPFSISASFSPASVFIVNLCLFTPFSWQNAATHLSPFPHVSARLPSALNITISGVVPGFFTTIKPSTPPFSHSFFTRSAVGNLLLSQIRKSLPNAEYLQIAPRKKTIVKCMQKNPVT